VCGRMFSDHGVDVASQGSVDKTRRLLNRCQWHESSGVTKERVQDDDNDFFELKRSAYAAFAGLDSREFCEKKWTSDKLNKHPSEIVWRFTAKGKLGVIAKHEIDGCVFLEVRAVRQILAPLSCDCAGPLLEKPWKEGWHQRD
jgi:hypothetical protein